MTSPFLKWPIQAYVDQQFLTRFQRFQTFLASKSQNSATVLPSLRNIFFKPRFSNRLFTFPQQSETEKEALDQKKIVGKGISKNFEDESNRWIDCQQGQEIFQQESKYFEKNRIQEKNLVLGDAIWLGGSTEKHL